MDARAVIEALRPYEEALRGYSTAVEASEQQKRQVVVLRDADLDASIRPLLQAQPEFLDPTRGLATGLGCLGLSPLTLCNRLYFEAGRIGVEAAVAGFERAVSAPTTEGRFVGALQGVIVERRIDLGEGLYLIPIAELPNSRNKEAVTRPFNAAGILLQGRPASTVIVAEVPSAPWIVSMADEQALAPLWAARDRLNAVALALTAAHNCTPILSPYWYEVADPDLAPYCLSGFMQPLQGGVSLGATPIDDVAQGIVQAFEAFSQRDREVLGFFLRRLHSAKIELEILDKALDACICLEAMLSGNNEKKYTSAVQKRGKLFVSELKSRRNPSKALKSLLRLRGKVAHGRQPTDRPGYPIADIVHDGIDICEQILGRMLAAGHLPRWGVAAKELISAADATRLGIEPTAKPKRWWCLSHLLRLQ